MYEWGKVKKVLGNKTGITSYSWTVCIVFGRCISLHDHANFLCTAKLSKDVLPLNLVSVLLCSLNQILLGHYRLSYENMCPL